ncbi:peptidoglycan DD-metalloendopeptidase family protein [Microbacterium sp.]|uniref:M23 family metallopeptidase n=1 Tax=Microbacterium sp. TaxID=51671 RepID=UPI002810C91A|nr:peptidoglycan DD-metalloendopeptidase family protein [Microbacterium sp.]
MAPPTAAQVESAATSRRARRLANAGAPAAQPVTEPAPQAVVEDVLNVAVAQASASTRRTEQPADENQAPSVHENVSPVVGESEVDAFVVASQAFGFAPVADESDVDEVLTAVESETQREDEAITDGATDHVVPHRPRPLRKVLAAGASLGVMGVAGMIAVSMTLPANAVAAVQGGAGAPVASLVTAKESVSTPKVEKDDIQAFVASSGVQDEDLARSDSFSTVSLADVAAEEGIDYSSEVFTNDPGAAIQWPFMVGVGMSYGYGMRSGRLHEGIDFVPGNGAPVQAIADGTVRIATEQGGAYGVTVYIDHVIDGQVITSHYAHMQYGSLRVQPGEKVTVGTVVGKTGNTGRSYGAHLHFEIIVNGSTIDPLPWLRKNAGRYDGVTLP